MSVAAGKVSGRPKHKIKKNAQRRQGTLTNSDINYARITQFNSFAVYTVHRTILLCSILLFFCSSPILEAISLLAFITRDYQMILPLSFSFVCSISLGVPLSLTVFFFANERANALSLYLTLNLFVFFCPTILYISISFPHTHTHTLYLSFYYLCRCCCCCCWCCYCCCCCYSDKNTIISHKSVLTLSRNTQIYCSIHTDQIRTANRRQANSLLLSFVLLVGRIYFARFVFKLGHCFVVVTRLILWR